MKNKRNILGFLAQMGDEKANQIQIEFRTLLLKRKIGFQDFTEYLGNPSLLENIDASNKSNILSLFDALNSANISNPQELEILLSEEFKIKKEGLFDINALIDLDDEIWDNKKEDKKKKNG